MSHFDMRTAYAERFDFFLIPGSTDTDAIYYNPDSQVQVDLTGCNTFDEVSLAIVKQLTTKIKYGLVPR